jgi:hypothetical protein
VLDRLYCTHLSLLFLGQAIVLGLFSLCWAVKALLVGIFFYLVLSLLCYGNHEINLDFCGVRFTDKNHGT